MVTDRPAIVIDDKFKYSECYSFASCVVRQCHNAFSHLTHSVIQFASWIDSKQIKISFGRRLSSISSFACIFWSALNIQSWRADWAITLNSLRLNFYSSRREKKNSIITLLNCFHGLRRPRTIHQHHEYHLKTASFAPFTNPSRSARFNHNSDIIQFDISHSAENFLSTYSISFLSHIPIWHCPILHRGK